MNIITPSDKIIKIFKHNFGLNKIFNSFFENKKKKIIFNSILKPKKILIKLCYCYKIYKISHIFNRWNRSFSLKNLFLPTPLEVHALNSNWKSGKNIFKINIKLTQSILEQYCREKKITNIRLWFDIFTKTDVNYLTQIFFITYTTSIMSD